MKRRNKIRNGYNRDLLALRDYLLGDINPWHFELWLPEYYKSIGKIAPKNILRNPRFESRKKLTEDFKLWIARKEEAKNRSNGLPPSYNTLEFAQMAPPSTWLVHFSDEVGEIADRGFLYGVSSMSNLALTRHTNDSERKKSVGWNFALIATSEDAEFAAHRGRYGREAVLFQSAAVIAKHYGDHEDQAIFRGDGVLRFIVLNRSGWGGEWFVVDNETGRRMTTGNYGKVIRWAIRHHKRYAQQIVRDVKP